MNWKKPLTLFCFLFSLLLSPALIAETKPSIRIALDDLPGVDMLNLLTAIERVKARGVNIELNYYQSEGMAAQAVVHGHADIGMGTPYALIQQTKAPIRMFYQLNKLRFHPVVNTKYFTNWKDLDGIVMHTHGAGSGTEAIMNMMAKKHGISYSGMKYVPGSGVRAKAMLQERIKATVVDTERRNLLLQHRSGKFAVLPMPDIHASDEALYANQAFIDGQQHFLQILVEELLHVWRTVNSTPGYILEMRKNYGLLSKLSSKRVDEITTFYQELSEAGAFPNDGGSELAFQADINFYGYAGTITGDTSQLSENDFWDFRALRAVLDKEKSH